MNAKLFGAVIVAGLVAAGCASAQTSTTQRRCEGDTCVSVTDSKNSTSTTTCKFYAGGASDCTSESKDKTPSAPSVQTVTYDAAHERAKADARSRAAYRDPNARVLGCGAGYRMTERDGCQPRR